MPTQLYRTLSHIPQEAVGGAISIGNFDGVHLGHQALIRRLNEEAKRLNASSIIITFEPLPFEFFHKGEETPPRLTRLPEKMDLLSQFGLDIAVILRFNQHLAKMSPEDFIVHALHQHLRMRHIVIGADFRFGFKRSGDVALLESLAERLHYKLTVMPTITSNADRISSTCIRQLLQSGQLHAARQLLGHPYFLCGRVKKGKQIGQTLGFPTANLMLKETLKVPLSGIYAVKVAGLSDHSLPGAAYIGKRPVMGGATQVLEVHLFDFNERIYNHYVKVEFLEKLRDDKHFQTIELLKKQISTDVDQAKQYFKKQGML